MSKVFKTKSRLALILSAFIFQACSGSTSTDSEALIETAVDSDPRIEMINESLSVLDSSSHQVNSLEVSSKSFYHIASVEGPISKEGYKPQATNFASYKDRVYVVYNTAGAKLFGGFDVLDVSNPLSPKILFSSLFKDAEFSDVATDGKHAYAVGANADGAFLRVFSVEDKSMGKVLSEISLDGYYATSLEIVKKELYISVGDAPGVYRIDISKPEELEVQSLYELPNAVYAFSSKKSVYALGGKSGLSVHEISDEQIKELVEVNRSYPEAPVRAYIEDGLLFTNPNQSGLYIYRMNERNSEIDLVSRTKVSGTGNGLFVDDDYAYLAQGDAGVQIYDLDDISEPIHVATLDFRSNLGSANAVEHVSSSKAKYLFIADGKGGFQIVEIVSGVKLEASKFYNPSRWEDAIYPINGWFQVQIPTEVEVTAGNAGNHWVDIFFDSVKCRYQGGSSQSKPLVGSKQWHLGSKYKFKSCESGYKAKDSIEVSKEIRMNVANGHSSYKSTSVSVKIPFLENLGF